MENEQKTPKRSALQRIMETLSDGEPRTVRRVAYLSNVSLNMVRQALRDGHIEKKGEEPKIRYPLPRCGQAIVGLPGKEKRCRKTKTSIAA